MFGSLPTPPPLSFPPPPPPPPYPGTQTALYRVPKSHHLQFTTQGTQTAFFPCNQAFTPLHFLPRLSQATLHTMPSSITRGIVNLSWPTDFPSKSRIVKLHLPLHYNAHSPFPVAFLVSRLVTRRARLLALKVKKRVGFHPLLHILLLMNSIEQYQRLLISFTSGSNTINVHTFSAWAHSRPPYPLHFSHSLLFQLCMVHIIACQFLQFFYHMYSQLKMLFMHMCWL